MKFSQWLNESDEIQEIPIARLLMTKEEIAAAVSNLSRGLSSMTPGPLEVSLHKALGKYQLTNGYHRLVETLMSGRTSVPVKVTGMAEWRPPSNKELFVPNWNADYFGMEDFIEYYELKRLR